jgi:hypothetical protein
MKIVFYLGTALLILESCSEPTVNREALQTLLLQEKKIKCELIALKAEIIHEWDAINLHLEENLPPAVPEEEKNNMLQVRNANLIRMFESFRDFNHEVKDALKDVEIKDQKISTRINELKKALHKLEANKMLLFDEINRQEGKSALHRYAASYQEALQKTCN